MVFYYINNKRNYPHKLRKVATMFTSMTTPNTGFSMTFNNGYDVSVQWSIGNYCGKIQKTENVVSCKSAEVAIFDMNNKGENVTKKLIPTYTGNCETAEFLTTENVAGILSFISSIVR